MDPYQVLGVSPNASDDDVKRAYRALSRKYHPDANVNNPNRGAAEEKFKQVQQAYDSIMKMRQRGETYNGSFQSHTTGGTYGGRTNAAPELQAAANYIANGYYQEALTTLNGMEVSQRGGVWYYMAAIASEGLGDLTNAREYASMAVAMEPSNYQFRQYMMHLNNNDMWYTTRSSVYQRPYEGYSHWCLDLFLMNLFCGCCC